MRILMLGNSFTFYHDMPKTLAALTGAEVTANTRGGARLSEQLNPSVELGARALAALQNEKWDYVVLQEMSNGPITAPKSFFRSVGLLCEAIRLHGAVPVLYATWAYEDGGSKLASMGMEYEKMFQSLYDAYHEAAIENNALIADVGLRFFEYTGKDTLFEEDSYHPSELGSRIAAETLAQVILDHEKSHA